MKHLSSTRTLSRRSGRASLGSVTVLVLAALAPPASAQPIPNAQVPGRSAITAPTFTPPPPAPPRAFNVVAFGDSIMWGQGLAEPHKFTSLVRDWLQGSAGTRPVTLGSTAHSGASVDIPPGIAASWDALPPEPGEIPSSFPTITRQARSLATGFVIPNSNVDLVLLDGGANDVGLTTVASPTGGDIGSLVLAKIEPAARNILTAAMSQYPNARIVMTGYYPAVSEQTDLSAVADFFGKYHVAIPAPDPGLRSTLTARLKDFHRLSNDAYQRIADGANVNAGRKRVTFVPIPWSDEAAAGAPQSMLWRVWERDEVRTQRVADCAIAVPKTRGETLTQFVCENASMFHPNVSGAAHYARQIEAALAPDLCDLFSLRPMSTSIAPHDVNADAPTTVRVTALDRATGAAVPGARVSIAVPGHAPANGAVGTDITAWFLMDRVQRGKPLNVSGTGEVRANVMVSAPGYCPAVVSYGFAPPTPPATATPTNKLTVTVAWSTPVTAVTQKLTVFVKDSLGHAVAANVGIGTLSFPANSLITHNVCTGRTDETLSCKNLQITAPGFTSVTMQPF